MASVTETLLKAMFDSGLSYYRIAADTKIPVSSLVRFGNRQQTLRGETIDVLAEYLGLELRPKDKAAAAPESKPKTAAPPKKRPAKKAPRGKRP